MATTKSPAFDDLDEIEEPSTQDDSWIELEPGDSVTGSVTDFSPRASYNGVIEIDGRPYRLNASLRRSIVSALIEDAVIGIRKSDSKESFEDDDGEEIEYYPREARIKVGGDA